MHGRRVLPHLIAGVTLLILPSLLGSAMAADSSSGTLTVTGGLSNVDELDIVDQNGTSLSNAEVGMGPVAAGSTGAVAVLRFARRLKITIGDTTTSTGTVTMQPLFGSLCTGCTSNNEWRSTTTPVLSMAAGGTSTTGRSTGSGTMSANTANFSDQNGQCAGHVAGSGYTVLSTALTIHRIKKNSSGCVTHVMSGVTLKHFVPSNQPNDTYETKLLFTLSV